ncbi:hypothetical protein [Companilactobacillus furfuricola]|uniref:hypothetical protein n=1 Tax=Companilactobacillus furfuricola TaxID=1462575 RepID=UPI000F77E642|nr:hypothetical protein [Companilactobacillus furfuricola]
MSLKTTLLTSVAILGLGIAPSVTTILNSAQSVNASTTETINTDSNRAINEWGKVKVLNGVYVSTYDSNGNILDGRMAAPDSEWITDQHIFVNGHFFFRIGVNTYLRDEDVIFSPS